VAGGQVVVGVLAELGLPSAGQRWSQIALGLLALAPLAVLAGLPRTRLERAKVGGLVVELGDTPGVGVREPLTRPLVHDGAQQRLVNLSLVLGVAQARVDVLGHLRGRAAVADDG
jgi:hypothetical protein